VIEVGGKDGDVGAVVLFVDTDGGVGGETTWMVRLELLDDDFRW